MSDLRFCAECACGYEWQPGWGGLCGGCRRAEILERERDVALDRITALEADLDSSQQRITTYAQEVVDRLEAAEAEVARLRKALLVYVEDDCRELAEGEGLTDEEARRTYSPRYRWGRAALAAEETS